MQTIDPTDIREAFRVLRDQARRGFETLIPIIAMVEDCDTDTAVERMKEIRDRYFSRPNRYNAPEYTALLLWWAGEWHR
jgi:hypothetical protein